MTGLDLNKTFQAFSDPTSEAYQGGMMDKVEWIDEELKIFRMVISIPLFTKRDIVAQMKLDERNGVIMMKSVTSDKCPEQSGIVRAQMTDCFRLEEVDGGIKLTEVMTFDLGGWMPASMMNMLIGSSLASE